MEWNVHKTLQFLKNPDGKVPEFHTNRYPVEFSLTGAKRDISSWYLKQTENFKIAAFRKYRTTKPDCGIANRNRSPRIHQEKFCGWPEKNRTHQKQPRRWKRETLSRFGRESLSDKLKGVNAIRDQFRCPESIRNVYISNSFEEIWVVSERFWVGSRQFCHLDWSRLAFTPFIYELTVFF